MESTELMHYGVKGMKWGVRRKRWSDAAKAHDAKTQARDKARQEKVSAGAKKFKDAAKAHDAKTQARDKARQEKLAKKAKRGAKAVAGTLAKVGEAYVVDQMFFGGYGTTACKEALRTVGMATITAYTMARGGYDIKWYDKAGNRVG